MPHQCLSCGFAFEEGSSALLKGCPECKGTKFFYTEAAVDADARQQIARDAGQDLRHTVAEMLQDAAPDTAAQLQAQADEEGWAQLSAKDMRRLLKQVQAETKAVEKAQEQTGLDPDAELSPSDHAKRARQAAEAAKRMLLDRPKEERPDTVTVAGQGEYEIDVQGLLEKEPIVVQKDGAYLIHLPSLFQDRD